MVYEWLLKITDRATAPMQNATTAASKLDGAMRTVDGSSKKANSGLSSLASSSSSLSMAFAGWANMAVDAGLRTATAFIGMGTSFEATMSKVKAVTGTTGEDFGKLQKLAEDMGEKTKFSASEAAGAMANLGMAGFTASQIMDALPATLQLAAASGVDLAFAAEVAGNALSAYGMKANELQRVVDLIAKTTVTANTDTTDFAEAFKYAAPLAKTVGIQIEELAAAIGLLSNAGIKGSLAGTGLQMAMSRLLKPSDEAQKVMDRLGLSVQTANGKLLPLSSIMEQLEKSSASAADILEIFGVEAGGKMLALLEKGSAGLRTYTADLSKADGYAKNLATTMSDNLQGSLDEASSRVEGLAIALFQKVQPALKSVVAAFGKFASFLKDNTELVAAAAGGLLTAGTAFVVFEVAAWAASVAAMGLNAALLANPVGLVIAGVGLLAGGLVYLYSKFDAVKKVVDALGSVFLFALKVVFVPLWEGLKAIGSILMWVWDKIQPVFDGFSKLYDFFAESDWSKVADGFKAIGSMLGFVSNEADKATKAVNGLNAAATFNKMNEWLAPQKMIGPLLGGSESAATPSALASSQESMASSGMKEVAGGGPQQKVFNITIEKFQDTVQFVSNTVNEGIAQSQDAFEEMLLRVLNGIQAKQ